MSKNELPKAYVAAEHEDRIAQIERESGFYTPENLPGDRPDPFTIMLPPPNATGTLHMGHAVMLAIEDIMIRFQRMRGKKALWLPGTDHAAIATHSKVEKILFKETGKTRHDIGREAFVQKIDEFVESSRDTIKMQVRKMGCSIDWTREAFTLDEERNFAVRTMFKNMYDDGLIYRGHRIVNWDPNMQSNVSDEEVDRQEEKTKFYYFQYGPFEIGTARPETKFGDKYVVMHPDDARYAEYEHGQKIELEWINGPMTATVIKDEAADPEFGTGVMTITPWHSVIDFEMAERHGLEKEQIIDYNGNLLPIAEEFAGMPIEEARDKIVEKLDKKGLLIRIDEEYVHQLAVNSRGGGVIEPQIREQWFIDVRKKFTFRASTRNPIAGFEDGQEVSLQELMQHVVRDKQVQLIPERFEKNYFNWVDNLRDWCISRQIWYGHQIPAWYKDGEVYVGVEAPEGEGWVQDPDTLDTWFSSGIWTFSTLGWPKKSSDLETYHPTTVLETGRDILTFWVVRMILMTCYGMGEIPFKYVYLHGLVRDDQGRKMSKSLDNIIDPLDVVAKFGTDAVRLSLVMGMTPGNDTNLSEEKIAGYRNFTNKLWNIARFVMMSVDEVRVVDGSTGPKTEADKWIVARLNETIASVTEMLDEPKFMFSQAGEILRDFTWGDFADWYVEVAKVQLADPELKTSTEEVLLHVLECILKMWHPFMPYVTTRLWEEFGTDEMLLVSEWPVVMGETDGSAFEAVKDVVTSIRNIRSTYNVAPSKKVDVTIAGEINGLDEVVKRLARVENLTVAVRAAKPEGAVAVTTAAGEVYVDLGGAVDVEAEKARIGAELQNVSKYLKGLEAKLNNDKFTANAPEAVVAAERAKYDEANVRREALENQLSQLG